eukprot:1155879-Pelagomonas_calceolata.AAC.2
MVSPVCSCCRSCVEGPSWPWTVGAVQGSLWSCMCVGSHVLRDTWLGLTRCCQGVPWWTVSRPLAQGLCFTAAHLRGVGETHGDEWGRRGKQALGSHLHTVAEQQRCLPQHPATPVVGCHMTLRAFRACRSASPSNPELL